MTGLVSRAVAIRVGRMGEREEGWCVDVVGKRRLTVQKAGETKVSTVPSGAGGGWRQGLGGSF